ncbi:putative Alpha-1,2 mannosyltransferase KTR1 [Glarea lozoyensis 74030]|uniref:Putative Alpha-1,2 mannosyltransferase KTR1 n=1 Tax=Glarea lozoyensis (strain ATCC 74030 / MF5533) TaxID=1104152 RepID=H0EE80_GLAL7|nr:putative Alpha-1,2 mannosyltransferase KTR1 [Glarea lozoyensis 74030]
MKQLEERWNSKYQYPWIFFNDEPFTDEFKGVTQNLTAAKCHYEIVPKEHWSLPEWIDEDRFMNSLEYLGTIGVGKGWLVQYFCNIDYDVFRFMRDNNMKYGFNMNILDDARSFPSLWSKTRDFMKAHRDLLNPEADLKWLQNPETSGDYNNCQFFSNFEIGSLKFWRDKGNEAYFDWLDKSGGFYYERFGDAPVHTLSVAIEGKCFCEPTRLDENFYKLVPLESPQKKPLDTCIRQFLGGEWLKKKDGWTMAGEKAFGGDGYHGYEALGC